MDGNCYFCKHNFQEIDFKDIRTLGKFTSGLAKIRAKKRTRVCSLHQRKLAKAIKRARHFGLLPYTTK
ncbi:MAG TPA: 30S ribosomal protein S18 [Candidatus Nealsonbacteria bacterium]|nr:30S ribosomal protein S18 [Candidatus Nealsonbacteria bacterium]HEB46230.1 30S ribosomal protein S18 [Candidatus Nealsonbacteria bacterium]